MTKIVILLISLQLSAFLFSQDVDILNAPINSCEGAVNIFDNGNFNIQFTGEKGLKYINEYPSLTAVEEENTLWCSFIAPKDGILTFDAESESEYLQMVVFIQDKAGICEQIKSGVAEIKRLNINKETNYLGLSTEVTKTHLYALQLKEGEKINILFNTLKNYEGDLNLDWNFNSLSDQYSDTKIIDKRYDDFGTTLSFIVFDEETKMPLIASLEIEGSKKIDGLYNGSEFYFNLERNTKLTIKCDVEGFFFADSLYQIIASSDRTIKIPMKQIATGKSIIIEEIEFEAGTSIITDKSTPNLRRLKDFLALNSDVKIEIQGHVYASGKNTMSAQRVSEARAKRVMKYLTDNGIDKKRLSAVGYGNTHPIFEKPEFSYEEQANRRVEILIQ